MKKKAKWLQVRIAPEEKRRMATFARRRQESVSTLVRRAVATLMTSKNNSE